MPLFNAQSFKNSNSVMRRYFSSMGKKKFGRKQFKEVQAIANPMGTTSCVGEFNALITCFSASAEDAPATCATEIEAMDNCLETMPTKKRGTLLFHLQRIINSGGAKRPSLKWE